MFIFCFIFMCLAKNIRMRSWQLIAPTARPHGGWGRRFVVTCDAPGVPHRAGGVSFGSGAPTLLCQVL